MEAQGQRRKKWGAHRAVVQERWLEEHKGEEQRRWEDNRVVVAQRCGQKESGWQVVVVPHGTFFQRCRASE
jgi:hypothetical protein